MAGQWSGKAWLGGIDLDDNKHISHREQTNHPRSKTNHWTLQCEEVQGGRGPALGQAWSVVYRAVGMVAGSRR